MNYVSISPKHLYQITKFWETFKERNISQNLLTFFKILTIISSQKKKELYWQLNGITFNLMADVFFF